MPNFSYTGYIYRITNTLNNKQYIGKTFNLKKRITQHFCGHGGTRALDKATIIDIINIIGPSSPKETIKELNTAPNDPAILLV